MAGGPEGASTDQKGVRLCTSAATQRHRSPGERPIFTRNSSRLDVIHSDSESFAAQGNCVFLMISGRLTINQDDFRGVQSPRSIPIVIRPLENNPCRTLMTVEIHEAIIAALGVVPERLDAALAKELAVALYTRGTVSLGSCVRMSGMRRQDFEMLLAQRRVVRNYSMDDLEADLAWASRQELQPAESGSGVG